MKVACLLFKEDVPLSKIAEFFLRFSPQIGLRKNQALFIEIGKCHHLYSEEGFIARSKVILRQVGLEAVIALGKDVTDSLAFARYHRSSAEALPLQALLDFVDPFDRDPLLQKGTQELIHIFEDLGIQTLGAFKKLPVSNLIARFGALGRFCQQRVTMSDFVHWPVWTPAEVLFEKKDFPSFEFYGELEPLLFELKTQLDHIFSRLYGRKKKATQLQIEIKTERFSTNPYPVRVLDFDFFAPQGSTKGTLRILKERLSREFEKRPLLAPIESLTTKVLRTVDFEGGQRNIFNNQEERLEQLYSLHNQLVEILGKENIFQAQLTEDRRPERSWKKYHGPPHQELPAPTSLSDSLPERSTYLCKHPLKIEISAGFIRIKNKKYRILKWDPTVEKISGGWFETPQSEIENTFERSYYHVELEGHKKITVFETPHQEFYLHGYYG